MRNIFSAKILQSNRYVFHFVHVLYEFVSRCQIRMSNDMFKTMHVGKIVNTTATERQKCNHCVQVTFLYFKTELLDLLQVSKAAYDKNSLNVGI